MGKVRYPDDVIRARRQSIEVAENLEIRADGDKFILELFKEKHSVHGELSAAFDEAATLILSNQSVDSVSFVQTDKVWGADMSLLRASLYAMRKK